MRNYSDTILIIFPGNIKSGHEWNSTAELFGPSRNTQRLPNLYGYTLSLLKNFLTKGRQVIAAIKADRVIGYLYGFFHAMFLKLSIGNIAFSHNVFTPSFISVMPHSMSPIMKNVILPQQFTRHSIINIRLLIHKYRLMIMPKRNTWIVTENRLYCGCIGSIDKVTSPDLWQDYVRFMEPFNSKRSKDNSTNRGEEIKPFHSDGVIVITLLSALILYSQALPCSFPGTNHDPSSCRYAYPNGGTRTFSFFRAFIKLNI